MLNSPRYPAFWDLAPLTVWCCVSCRLGFLVAVRVLSRLSRPQFLEKLSSAYRVDRHQFFGHHNALADPTCLRLRPLRQIEWTNVLGLDSA